MKKISVILSFFLLLVSCSLLETATVIDTRITAKANEQKLDEKEKALKEFIEVCNASSYDAGEYKEIAKRFEIAEALNPDIDSQIDNGLYAKVAGCYFYLARNIDIYNYYSNWDIYKLPSTEGKRMNGMQQYSHLINKSIKYFKKLEDWENEWSINHNLGTLYGWKKTKIVAVDYYYKSAVLILNGQTGFTSSEARSQVLEIIDYMNDNVPESPLIGQLMDRIYSTDSNMESQDIKTEFTGSGFIINADGLVVTNYHVIKDKENIKVYLPDKGLQLNAELLLKDVNNDIAILRMDSYPRNRVSIPYGLGHSYDIKVGQDVFTVGFPLGEILGQHPKLSSGKVNSLYGILDNPTLIQISNPIQPGNSGGALFNRKGEIIGIVISSLNAKYFYENADIIPQNVNFAVKVDYLNVLISMLPEANKILNRKSQIGNLSLEKQFDSIRPFVVQVLAN